MPVLCTTVSPVLAEYLTQVAGTQQIRVERTNGRLNGARMPVRVWGSPGRSCAAPATFPKGLPACGTL